LSLQRWNALGKWVAFVDLIQMCTSGDFFCQFCTKPLLDKFVWREGRKTNLYDILLFDAPRPVAQ